MNLDFLDLSVIKALKIGKVPSRGTRRLAVGRDLEIAEMERILSYVAGGGFECRLLRGDYGSGKTFFLSVIRELAFERHFAVAVTNLSREIPFGKRDLVVGEILRGLRSPDSGNACALADYLRRWLDRYDPLTPYQQNEPLRAATMRVANADSGMVAGLRAFQSAYIADEPAHMDAILAWLRGEPIDPEVRKKYTLLGKLTPDGAFRRLRAVVALLKDADVPGLVVLVDEAETIYRLGNSGQRLAAYTAIREIIDNGDDEFPSTLFLFAGTPEFFEDEFRGIASYPALYQRIRSNQVTSQRDLRQPIIRLEDLDRDGLVAISTRVRDLHGSAYAYDATVAYPDPEIERFVTSAGEKFGSIHSKPRAYLKALVDELDARQQHLEGVHALDATTSAVEPPNATLDDDIVLAEF